MTLLPGFWPQPQSSGEWIVDLRHAYHKMRGQPFGGAQRERPLQGHSLAVFFRSLAALYGAGVRLDRALRLLSEQADDPVMAHTSLGLAGVVAAGAPLSKAMAAWSECFSPMQLQMVRMGESTGRLGQVLERLAAFEEKRRAMHMRVTSALTYPLVIFALAMLGLVVVPPYLLGAMKSLVDGAGVHLPWMTRIVFAFSRLMGSPWLWLAMAASAPWGWRTVRAALADDDLRYRLATWIDRLPLLGKLVRLHAASRLARALELPLAVGLPLASTLELAFEATADPLLSAQRGAVLRALEDGRSLAGALGRTDCLSAGFLSMVRVGEESGRLPELMGRLADLYELELDQALQATLAALEPCMLGCMGLVVGVLVLATVLPLAQVLERL